MYGVCHSLGSSPWDSCDGWGQEGSKGLKGLSGPETAPNSVDDGEDLNRTRVLRRYRVVCLGERDDLALDCLERPVPRALNGGVQGGNPLQEGIGGLGEVKARDPVKTNSSGRLEPLRMAAYLSH